MITSSRKQLMAMLDRLAALPDDEFYAEYNRMVDRIIGNVPTASDDWLYSVLHSLQARIGGRASPPLVRVAEKRLFAAVMSEQMRRQAVT